MAYCSTHQLLPLSSSGLFPCMSVCLHLNLLHLSLMKTSVIEFRTHSESRTISSSSVTKSCPNLQPMDCTMLGFPVLHCLLEFAQTHVHRVDDAIQPSHPLLSPSPPALNLPSIRVFSNKSALRIRWPNYWSFSFNISPMHQPQACCTLRQT